MALRSGRISRCFNDAWDVSGPAIRQPVLQARDQFANVRRIDRVFRMRSPSDHALDGLLAVAYIFRGIRPARNASRPAMTACFIASAMATGFSAPAMAVFISTPSAPSSIASAASDAVPTPASTITGTSRELADDADVVGVLNAEAGPDRRAERHHGRRAGVLELPAGDRIVVRIGQDDEAFPDEDARRFDQGLVVGEERPLVADHLELHPVR